MSGQGKTQEAQPGEPKMPASSKPKQEDHVFKANLGNQASEPKGDRSKPEARSVCFKLQV